MSTSAAHRIDRVMDHLTVVGERDKVSGRHASDSALWAIARGYDRAECPGEGELVSRDVDVDLLGDMRMAYEVGRDPAALLCDA